MNQKGPRRQKKQRRIGLRLMRAQSLPSARRTSRRWPSEREPHIVSTSRESIALAKDLKEMAWKFVGPTTVYAFMQAMGLVNDHVEGCVIRRDAAHMRAAFDVPRRSADSRPQ